MVNFFSRFFSPKPTFNPALGDRLATTILKEAKVGKLQTALEAIAPLRKGGWDQRAFYTELAGRYLPHAEALAVMPDSALGNLIKGNYYIHSAWDARGGGKANTVSNEGWILFFERLDKARIVLERAAQQDAEDPCPLATLQTVGMGSQLERTIIDKWFLEAISRDRFNQQAHYRKLFALCEKWGGSHQEMYNFARQTLSHLPEKSTLHSLIYLAYQEHFLYLASFEKDINAARALTKNSAVQAESITMYERSFKQRSTVESVADYWPHNTVAWWFMIMGKKEQARQEAKKIGLNFTEFPWRIFYSPETKGYEKFLHFTK